MIRAFKENFDMTADQVWENRRPGCDGCEDTSEKMSAFYNMTSRLLNMLWHRVRNMAAKVSKLEAKIEDLEGERAGLREVKKVWRRK